MFRIEHYILAIIFVVWLYNRFFSDEIFIDNMFKLEGEITIKNVKKLIDLFPETGEINLLINSNGGDLIQAWRLIERIGNSKNQFICYVDKKAKSAAFDIFQFCDVRIVSKNAVLAQHNAIISISGTFEDLSRYFEEKFYLEKEIDDSITNYIAKKLKISLTTYKLLLDHEFMIKGSDIVKNNLADKLLNFRYSK